MNSTGNNSLEQPAFEGTNEVKNVIEHGRCLLFDELDALDGEKTIVWDRDRSLMQRVNLFVSTSMLASHGVVANHAIESRKAATTPYVVFFLSPTIVSLDLLCDYIDNVGTNNKTLYQLYFIPEAWYVVREKLKIRSKGKYWNLFESVKEIPLYWLPRDGECLSLSLLQTASRLLINGDWTVFHKCAVALSQLIEMNCGMENRPMPIYYRGKWSNDICNMVQKIRNSNDVNCQQRMKPIFDAQLKLNRIVVIDRWLDPLTPLLTQLTYAGLLDELFEIGMVNSIKVPLMEFEEKEDGDPFETKEIHLNDEVYHRVKHSHINAFGQEAAKILTELREDEQFDREKMSVAEYAILVKKMPRIIKKKQLTSTHMRLAEMSRMSLYCQLVDVVAKEKELLEVSDGDRVVQFIEEQIYEAAPLNRVLRLIAVHSLTAGGLKPSVVQMYRRIVNQSYGSSALNKMLKMQKMGLIREKAGSGKMQCEYAPMLFPQMKKQYDLLPSTFSEANMGQISYAYSGFAPLLVKIIEEGDKLRWAGWNKNVINSNSEVVDTIGDTDSRGTCLFVVGGLTRAELALIRQTIPNITLVSTTAIMNGDSLLNNITRI